MCREAGIPVFGTAPSQAATNVLRRAIKGKAWNHSRFLGHMPEGGGVKGARPLPRGSVLIVDEASMSSMPDLADLARLATRRDWHIVMIGDPQQLQAVG